MKKTASVSIFETAGRLLEDGGGRCEAAAKMGRRKSMPRGCSMSYKPSLPWLERERV